MSDEFTGTLEVTTWIHASLGAICMTSGLLALISKKSNGICEESIGFGWRRGVLIIAQDTTFRWNVCSQSFLNHVPISFCIMVSLPTTRSIESRF